MSHLLVWSAVAVLSGHLAAALVFGQPGNAHLQGKIVDEGGKPIPAARVRYQRLPKATKDKRGRWVEAPGEAHVNAQSSTDAVGAYAAQQLPAGDYTLCVDAPGYLSSCEWSGWHRLSISSGHQLDFGSIALVRAATVTIRLDDSLHLLQSTAKASPPLAVGVMDQGENFHAASQVAADVSGRTYQLGVPYGKPMHLWVQTWKYRLADATGSALNSSGTLIPFQIATNTTLPTFTIRLTGTLR